MCEAIGNVKHPCRYCERRQSLDRCKDRAVDKEEAGISINLARVVDNSGVHVCGPARRTTGELLWAWIAQVKVFQQFTKPPIPDRFI